MQLDQLFGGLLSWFAKFWEDIPNIDEWLAALIASVLDFFKNLAA